MAEVVLLKVYGHVDPNLLSRCLCMIVLVEEWNENVYFENVEAGQVRENDGERVYSRDRLVKVIVSEVWKECRSWMVGWVEMVMLGVFVLNRGT